MKATVSSSKHNTDFFDTVTEDIGTISIHNLPSLHYTNIKRANERKCFYTK